MTCRSSSRLSQHQAIHSDRLSDALGITATAGDLLLGAKSQALQPQSRPRYDNRPALDGVAEIIVDPDSVKAVPEQIIGFLSAVRSIADDLDVELGELAAAAGL